MREIKFRKKLNSKVVIYSPMASTKVLWLIVMLFSRVRALNTVGKCFLPFGQKAGVDFGLMLRGI